MKCREIIEILETLAPKSCACDWDNPGLLAGRMDKDVKKRMMRRWSGRRRSGQICC